MVRNLGLPRDALNTQAAVSLSLQLAVALRAAIVQRELAIGAPLPSEPELAAYFGVSRDTAKRAYAVLRSAGVVETKRGKGSFVATRPPYLHVRVPRGTKIESRRPVWPGDRLALDAAGVALFTSVLVVQRPGREPELYDAAAVTIECV